MALVEEVVWGGGERGRGRGRSVTRLYGHETSSSPSSTRASSYIGTTTSLQPPTRILKGKSSSSPPPQPEWKADFPHCLRRQHCYWRRWQKLIPRLAFTSIELSLSLSLDCRRYCSLVETWRYISSGWTFASNQGWTGRQQTNCL